MSRKIYLYPVWVRLWHVLNAILFLILIVTGLSMHYAGSGNEFFSPIGFGAAVKWHNVAAIILIVNYGYFIIGNIISKNGRYYKRWRENFAVNLWKQFKYYSYGMFRNEPHPFPVSEVQKFNPLQKISYAIVMYLFMPILIISGLGLLFPELIAQQVFNVSGIIFYDVVHVVMGFVLSLFMVIHIYTCTLGDKPGTLFKSMINGYHEENH